jgi:hypothetical protein
MDRLVRDDGRTITVEAGDLLEVLGLAANFGAAVPPLAFPVSRAEAQAIAEAIDRAIAYLHHEERKGTPPPPPGGPRWIGRQRYLRLRYLWGLHRSSSWAEFADFCRGGGFRCET